MVPVSTARTLSVLQLVKLVHTLIWFVVEAAMLSVLYDGIRGLTGRRTAIAGAIVAVESAVFLGNRARCPLTDVAESLGAESGSVTDIFLPRWLAHNLPAIHVPLVAFALALHIRTLRRA
jgi:hypothetical protein